MTRCDHSTRIEYGGRVWCLDCMPAFIAPAEPVLDVPAVRPSGNFAEFLARATFEHS